MIGRAISMTEVEDALRMAVDRKPKLADRYANEQGAEQPFAPTPLGDRGDISEARPGAVEKGFAQHVPREQLLFGGPRAGKAAKPSSWDQFTGAQQTGFINRIGSAFEAAWNRVRPLFDAVGVENLNGIQISDIIGRRVVIQGDHPRHRHFLFGFDLIPVIFRNARTKHRREILGALREISKCEIQK
jgi:hypothetical protein